MCLPDIGPVVWRVGNFIQRINPYPADNVGVVLILTGQRANFIHWIGIYPLDKVIHSSYIYNRAKYTTGIYLFSCRSDFQSVIMSAIQSVYLSLCLSVCLSIYLSIEQIR